MKKYTLFCFVLFSLAIFAQENDFVLNTPTGDIFGTISVPQCTHAMPLVIIVAGSGPTDRNCNSPLGVNSNAYKQLSDSLLVNNIASLRYDKRGIAQSQQSGLKEGDLRFETYINDLKLWIDTLATDKRFSGIIVVGHSEGSLIGMVAAESNPKVAAVISIAGVAVPADEILKEQLSAQPQMVKDMIFPALDSLKNGKTVENVSPMLYSLLRPSVQPYMISWMKYNPQAEIAKLTIPILIIQGTTDIQVSENQADLLYAANQNAKVFKVENMNHILKICNSLDQTIQMQTYTNPELPLAEVLVTEIVKFIKLRPTTELNKNL